MKQFSLLVVLLVFCLGCKKEKDDVTPDISGIYNIDVLYNMEGEILNYPLKSKDDGRILVTSELEITRIDEYQISILRKGIGLGEPYTDPLGLFDIRKDGNEYVIYQKGLYIGYFGIDKVYLNFAGKSGNHMIDTIRASKVK